MTKHTLYSLRVDGDRQWRITKFVDGEVESSYICTTTECECPAGHRPSCRHRQMLPMMMAEHIDSTHWFWDFDLHRVVDFNGNLKSNFDAMNKLVEVDHHDLFAPAVGEAQHTEVLADLPLEHSARKGDVVGRMTSNRTPWRRL